MQFVMEFTIGNFSVVKVTLCDLFKSNIKGTKSIIAYVIFCSQRHFFMNHNQTFSVLCYDCVKVRRVAQW